jgi:outer membrane protein insertion porin family
MNRMPRVLFILLVCLPLPLPGQEWVEKVDIVGNERITRETVLYYFGLRSGAAYDEEAIDRGIEALWGSGFFADVKVAEKTGEKGRILILSVDEHPVVKNMVFQTGNRIKGGDIRDGLHHEKLNLEPYSVFDPQKMHEIKRAIERMLAEKGFDHASVSFELRKVGKFEVEARWHITEGPRYRIGEIIFRGNPRLNKNILLDAFRFNREHTLFSWLQGKDILKEAKLDEDLENLKKKYREFGYLEAQIGEPVIEEYSSNTVFGGQHRMKRIVIPVEAGDRYVLGHIKLSGNEHISSLNIFPLISMEKENVYDGKKIERSLDAIEALYQNRGYLFAQILSFEHLDSKEKRADLTIDIREGDMVYLGKLHFIGNTFTRDSLLRREMLVMEQQKFRMDLMLESLQRLARFGIARIEEPLEIKPDRNNPALMDVHLKLDERFKNEWELTGGYNGYQGTYLGGSFSVIDFSGPGERINLALEYGKRSKNYVLEFSKPYLFDRLFSLQSRLFDRDILYPGLFERKAEGFQIGLDTKIVGYWMGGLWYDFQNVEVHSRRPEDNGSSTDQSIGSLTAYISRDTIENPFFSPKGTRFLFSCGFAASALGSEIQYFKPEWEGTLFVPIVGKHVLGIHLGYKAIIPLRGSEIPYWERYYLGGERSIRGYDVYTVSPRNPAGQNVGGEKSFVINIEYLVPLLGPIYSVFFFDAGKAFRSADKVDLTDLYWSSGLEMRLRFLHVPIPIRLIFAYNNRLIEQEDSHFAFRIAFGASF